MSVLAYKNCIEADNLSWADKHMDRANELVDNFMPSGSGFNNGTTLNWEESTPEKLVFNTSYHYMNEHGYYTHWVDYTVTVEPSLPHLYTVEVTSDDRAEIDEWHATQNRDYVADMFNYDLAQKITE